MAVSMLDVLSCRITIGDATPGNPMVIQAPIGLTEVEEVEINKSYKKLTGMTNVVFPKDSEAKPFQIYFNYHVAQDGLKVVKTNPKFLAVTGKALGTDKKFFEVTGRLKNSEWGSKVVTQLSEFLRRNDPSLRGFSRKNLYRMGSFYETYSSAGFSEQIAALPFVSSEMIQFQTAVPMPRILTLVNWTSHIEILASCCTFQERIFYMLYANKERLNVKELSNAIAKDAYTTILSSPQNQSAGFKQIYPNNSYDFKDRAILDFLGLPPKHTEKQLQKGILEHMKEFILELGKDFLYMGSQVLQ